VIASFILIKPSRGSNCHYLTSFVYGLSFKFELKKKIFVRSLKFSGDNETQIVLQQTERNEFEFRRKFCPLMSITVAF